MTYRTRCTRRAALQRLRTVRPTVADIWVQHLQRLLQTGRSSSKYPRHQRSSDWDHYRCADSVWAASLLRADMIFGKEIADSRRPEETASDGRCDTRRCMALYELSPACGLRCSWAAYYCSMMSQRMAPLEADLRCSRSPGPPLQHGGVGGALQNARIQSAFVSDDVE
jgi:hypothetical protein